MDRFFLLETFSAGYSFPNMKTDTKNILRVLISIRNSRNYQYSEIWFFFC